MLVPALLFLSLTLLLLTIFILRRAPPLRLARIPHALTHRITSRSKKPLRPLSLERLELPPGPLSLESLSSRDLTRLEDAGRVGYHNPFDPSPSPSLVDGSCSSSCSSAGLASSPSPSPRPLCQSPTLVHRTSSALASHSLDLTSPLTEIIATPQAQRAHGNPWDPQRITKQASQAPDIEPSSAYDTVNLRHHHHKNDKTGRRTTSPATKHLSRLSWDSQLDKYFYADGVGIREG